MTVPFISEIFFPACALKEKSTVYEQQDTFVGLPRKHLTDYRDRGNWGTTYIEWSIALVV